MRCLMQNPGPNTHDPAFAVVVVAPSGNRIPICKRDLDWLLDAADDDVEWDPSCEPADLIFL